MGDFLNEYAVNSQVGLPLAVAIIFLLMGFGYFYNRLMDSLKGKEHTSLYVAGGVLVTIGAAALVSWKAALLMTILFILDGLPMIVGEFRRTHKQERQVRRKRMPYAANGLIDECKMSAEKIHKLIGEELKEGTGKNIPQMSHELTVVLLKLAELKNIQINEK